MVNWKEEMEFLAAMNQLNALIKAEDNSDRKAFLKRQKKAILKQRLKKTMKQVFLILCLFIAFILLLSFI